MNSDTNLKHDNDSIDIAKGLENVPLLIQTNLISRNIFNYTYCRVNIPGPGADVAKFEEEFRGCRCDPSGENCILNPACSCLSLFPSAYNVDARLLNVTADANMTPIYECNKNCSCAKTCSNRNVQHGVKIPLSIFQTDNRGLGVKTLKDIERGAFICEYAGEIISVSEAKFRSNHQKDTDMNYILVVKEYYDTKAITTCVDPRFIGNIGRFINHSCNPNLFMIPIRVNNEIPKFCLFAERDIDAGSELCYDYGGGGGNQQNAMNSDESSPRRKQCFCGTVMCKGVLPFDRTLYQ